MMFTSLQPIPSFFLSFKHRLWYFKYLKWRTITWGTLKMQTIRIYTILCTPAISSIITYFCCLKPFSSKSWWLGCWNGGNDFGMEPTGGLPEKPPCGLPEKPPCGLPENPPCGLLERPPWGELLNFEGLKLQN